ncbi:MAG: class I SAM-dependent RNA methyltransferase [Spirochaetes bacterium]|nr:MAG: class I SAM-dependent RNA methyltransferase [Spirochaetota bacterium]
MNNFLDIRIASLVYGGHGLGFPDGRAVFVPGTAPGDLARIRIVAEKKGYAFGEVVELLEASPSRIAPECPNFGRCGGCEYLHLDYDAERAAKQAILTESLARIGKIQLQSIPEIESVSGERFRYRSHAVIKTDLRGQAGFFARHSHDIVPFPEGGCLLLAGSIGPRPPFAAAGHAGEMCVAFGDNGSIIPEREGAVLREHACGIVYERGHRDFFQANRYLREKMLGIVGNYATAVPGDPGGFCDAGCGVGFFALHLARAGFSGTGFDSSTRLVRLARRNAALNAIRNVTFDAHGFSSMTGSLRGRKVLVCDPPRAGLDAKARGIVRALLPAGIVYVSCNPAAFARDCADFVSAGYALRALTLIDMFPGTYHIESISLFVRGDERTR